MPMTDISTRPGLTITATPIGNLADLSPRAAHALTNADIIACEDTRHTGQLLNTLGLTRGGRLVSYHDHTSPATRHRLITAMQQGKSVTLVCDAGTPLIADPGYRLVEACHAAQIPITAIPGPSAVLAGLVISGMPTDRFYFAGFLPTTANKRKAALQEILAIAATAIVYESSKRLATSLAVLAEIAETRLVFVARELTKKFEEGWRGEAHQLAKQFAATPPPKGEIVLVIAPPPPPSPASDAVLTKRLTEARASGLSTSQAVAEIHQHTQTSKSRLYRLALALRDKTEAE